MVGEIGKWLLSVSFARLFETLTLLLSLLIMTSAATSTGTLDELRNKLSKGLSTMIVRHMQMSKIVVVVDSDTDPKRAIEILIENKIRAAPVVEKNRFIGTLDLRDMVKFALDNYKHLHSNNKPPKKGKAIDYLTSALTVTTESLAYFAHMRPFHTVSENDSMVDVCNLMAHGSHIVGVVNGKHRLIGIVSQGQLFQQVSKIWMDKQLFDSCNVSLNDLHDHGFISSPVKSILNSSSAFDSFQYMSKFGLSGLAVVNADGRIIHNTSAVDIKLWLICSNTLEASIEQFLISIRKMSVIERYPVTVCLMKDSFERGVGKLQATKYHRLWIVNDQFNPIGVIALTDIFRFVTTDSISSNNNNNTSTK